MQLMSSKLKEHKLGKFNSKTNDEKTKEINV